MSVYIAGQTVEFRCTFTDADGTLVDPTDVTLRLRPPLGADQDYAWSGASVTRVSVGFFRVRATLGVVGVWLYRWRGTGPLGALSAGQVVVRPDVLA